MVFALLVCLSVGDLLLLLSLQLLAVAFALTPPNIAKSNTYPTNPQKTPAKHIVKPRLL
jgi:hypothetical protein